MSEKELEKQVKDLQERVSILEGVLLDLWTNNYHNFVGGVAEGKRVIKSLGQEASK